MTYKKFRKNIQRQPQTFEELNKLALKQAESGKEYPLADWQRPKMHIATLPENISLKIELRPSSSMDLWSMIQDLRKNGILQVRTKYLDTPQA